MKAKENNKIKTKNPTRKYFHCKEESLNVIKLTKKKK